jgi:hypothetical protein
MPREVVIDRGALTVLVSDASRYGELAQELGARGWRRPNRIHDSTRVRTGGQRASWKIDALRRRWNQCNRSSAEVG